jgi:hypothetical protein
MRPKRGKMIACRPVTLMNAFINAEKHYSFFLNTRIQKRMTRDKCICSFTHYSVTELLEPLRMNYVVVYISDIFGI